MNQAQEDLNRRLITSARDQDVVNVQHLLDQGANVNYQTLSGGGWLQTALMKVARNGNLEITYLLLDHGANLNLQDQGGHTALAIAILDCKETIVNTLLERGADTNIMDQDGNSPLTVAAWYCPNVAGSILQHGADIDHQDDSGVTALMQASERNDVKSVRMLLSRGADPTLITDEGQTALENVGSAFREPPNEEIVKLLTDAINNYKTRGAKVQDPITGITNLMILAVNGPDRALKTALESEALDLDRPDVQGNTPLIYAVQANNAVAVDRLLIFGADPSLANLGGGTALAYAIQNGNRDIALSLVESGASLGSTDDPLSPLSIGENSELLKEILDIPAITNCINVEDPITLEALPPRGTISIQWPGIAKGYCYDLRALRSYLRSQKSQAGALTQGGTVFIFNIPPQYNITQESRDSLLTNKDRQYRAEVYMDDIKLSRVDITVYNLIPLK